MHMEKCEMTNINTEMYICEESYRVLILFSYSNYAKAKLFSTLGRKKLFIETVYLFIYIKLPYL